MRHWFRSDFAMPISVTAKRIGQIGSGVAKTARVGAPFVRRLLLRLEADDLGVVRAVEQHVVLLDSAGERRVLRSREVVGDRSAFLDQCVERLVG